MTIQQLEYILAVDKFRHFGKAAEYCMVTQPTLSAMIQKLEEELDVKIFDRSTQPIQPTAVGRKVLEQAHTVMAQALKVKEIVKEEEQSLKGVFRMAVLPTIAPYLLPRFFPKFMEDYPEMDIRVSEMKTQDVLVALATGKVDAAIIATAVDGKSLQVDTLFYEQFLGYVSRKESVFKNEVIRSTDISGERLWLLDEGHCFRDQLMRFCQLEAVKLHQAAYHLGSMETFMRIVEGGKGITFIPELAFYQLSDQQKELVRPFAIPRPTREISIVTKTDFVRYSVLNVLKESIRSSVPKEMLTLQNTQRIV
ncbi:hydrogen peroxide-inducible genes activator [uncultured Bacteroides sp.]|uniref:hydrogen peroxide-inducible genes activator n=1 Tax=uncultured Bacteroides sp. TaxID=162156 RepID=UPI002AABAEC6|nr:hydrogen peroxide-inducible genes activator [uncultured Bacteroides sp.]